MVNLVHLLGSDQGFLVDCCCRISSWPLAGGPKWVILINLIYIVANTICHIISQICYYLSLVLLPRVYSITPPQCCLVYVCME